MFPNQALLLRVAVKPIYSHWVVVKENAVFLQAPSEESRQLVLKRPEFPEGFQGKVCKDSEGEGCGVGDQLVDILLIGWW